MDLNMEEQQPTTDNKKSILDFFAKENILDWCDTGKSILEDLPKETILEELTIKVLMMNFMTCPNF